MASIAPLSGIKVIDLTKLAPGPHCTMILGDLGADIVKVEEPGPPTGRRAEQAAASGKTERAVPVSACTTRLGRNKKSIGLNLKSGRGAKCSADGAAGRRGRGIPSRVEAAGN